MRFSEISGNTGLFINFPLSRREDNNLRRRCVPLEHRPFWRQQTCHHRKSVRSNDLEEVHAEELPATIALG